MTTIVSAVFPFPHLLLKPIEGKPKAFTVTRLRKELFANARSVHCTSGGVPVVVVPMVSLVLSWLLLLIFYVLVNPFYHPNIPAPSYCNTVPNHYCQPSL